MSAEGEAGRYTVVLTGKYGDERSYLVVDGDGNVERFSGNPAAAELRNEITFDRLPEAVKHEVLDIYREEWSLK